MTASRPQFVEGVQWRRLTQAERGDTPWKYVLLEEVMFGFYPKICGKTFELRDAAGTPWGWIEPFSVCVAQGYAWNGCTASPDWELLASVPHDLLYQFSGVPGFPATVTRHWTDDLFLALHTTPLGWLYRAGLFLCAWASWGQHPDGATVHQE